MAYPHQVTGVTRSNIKEFSKCRQEVSYKILKKTIKPEVTPFGARLRQAFNGARNKDIAQKLERFGVYNSTVSDYMKGKSLPDAEKLIEISRITKCNLHWLLTGEGEPGEDPFAFLSELEKRVIEKLAEIEEADFEKMLGVLLDEALAARASEVIKDHTHVLGPSWEVVRLYLKMVEAAQTEEGHNNSCRAINH